MKRLITLGLAALFAAGCATVKVDDEGGHRLCEIENNYWSLLGLVPLGSGDPELPNKNLCSFFQNTATVENNLKMLADACRRHHSGDVQNVVSHVVNRNYCFILCRHTLHTSAELMP